MAERGKPRPLFFPCLFFTQNFDLLHMGTCDHVKGFKRLIGSKDALVEMCHLFSKNTFRGHDFLQGPCSRNGRDDKNTF